MKKLLVLLLALLVAIVLVACGEPTATTNPDAETTPESTTAGAGGDETTPAESTPKAPDVTTGKPLFEEGYDILFGSPDYAAIDAGWNQGLWPCAFEEHHPELDYNWCVVFKMYPTTEFVQESLIAMDEEAGVGTAYEDYKWTLIIDDEEHVITEFSIPQRSGFIYVRMGLGADYKPVDGEHEYDIKLKITDATTGDIVYWAYFTDPDWGGKYLFTPPVIPEVIPTEKPETVESLPEGSLQGISGPAGYTANETYEKLFDGMARTKLCTEDHASNIIFMVTDNVYTYSIKGFGLVGANDDEKFPERVLTKFKIYGSDTGSADGSWNLLLSVDKSADFGTITNYGEYYYGLEEASEYRYYMIEVDPEIAKYQLSEVILYAEKGSVTTR